MSEHNELRELFHSWDTDKKKAFLEKLSIPAFNQFRYYSDCILRPDQQIPAGNWRYFIAQCARGWGKTLLGAHEIAKDVYAARDGLAIVAPTHSDIEDYIKTAFEDEFPSHKKPRYIGGDKQHFVCFNGIKVKCYSSDKEIRGSNLRKVWCDEFCAWCDRDEDKATDRFNVLDFALRKGKAQFIITTTPRPWKVMEKWNKRFANNDPMIQMIFGETEQNVVLSSLAKQALYDEFGNTRLGLQELHGKLLSNPEGALWNWDNLNKNRVPADPAFTQQGLNLPLFTKESCEHLIFVVIALDPAGSSVETSDEHGIIVCGLSNKGHGYVLHDASGHYTPNAMAATVSRLYHAYGANRVIVERNFGGDYIGNTIKTVDSRIFIKEVVASRGKMLRADPVGAKYEQDKVHHVLQHDSNGKPTQQALSAWYRLEHQMCQFQGLASTSKHKDDRVDALVFALTELMILPNIAQRSIINLPNFS